MDASEFNRFHFQILLWCFVIITFDGFDLVIYGSVLPRLMEVWHLTPIQSGVIGSYALVGMMLGALICGPIADRLGRRNVALLATVIFSLASAATSFVDDPTEFGILRFLTGVGLGGSLPNVIALMTEYSPRKIRNTVVAIMSTGYAVGGVLAAGLSIRLLPTHGWESLFLIGAFPLLIVPFMYKFMPESLSYHLKKENRQQVEGTLTKLNPTFSAQADDKYVLDDKKNDGKSKTTFSVIRLFQHGQAFGTFMIWIVIFMSLLMIYGLNTWLPKLMLAAGYPFGSSLLFLLFLNFGAIIGAVLGGWIADRWKVQWLLVFYYLIAALTLSLLGLKTNMFLLYVLVVLAGATTIGSQMISNIFTVQYYAPEIRATGIGWALGIGRLGGIVGPSFGGYLLSLKLSFYLNFIFFAIPGLIAAIALLLIRYENR